MDFLVELISMCTVVGAIIIATYQIVRHLVYYNEPSLQLYIVRIHLMLPIYGLTSWLSLVYPNQTIYFSSVRDCYEAYVLYIFICLLTEYLGGENSLIVHLEILQKKVSHPWPCDSCKPLTSDRSIYICRDFYWKIKQGVLQFVLIKPISALMGIVFESFQILNEGSFNPKTGYLYISIIDNTSITISLYALVYFYLATEEWLRPFRPLAKFLCIKSILFFSYWQGCAFTVLKNLEMFGKDPELAEMSSVKLQNFIICVETMAAAMAVSFAFSAQEFVDKKKHHNHMISNFGKILSVKDVILDAKKSFIDKKNEDERKIDLKQLYLEDEDIWNIQKERTRSRNYFEEIII